MRSAAFVLTALAVVGFSCSALAVQPIGYLDNAGCDVIAGWSQDPDVPDAPIDVHVYFNGPAGSPGASAIATHADVHRDDLCAAIGSCAHGYYVGSPFSLHDGAPHDVYAYAIDNAGEGNPLLGNSPRTLQCTAAAQTGIRRKVEGVPALDAWRFSTFWDVLPLSAADAEQVAEGLAMPLRPELVQADDGTPDVYLVDHGVRRHITLADVTNWRLDLGQVTKMPVAEVEMMPVGTALRPRPVLFVHGGLYVVDDPQPFVIPPMETGSSSSSTGGETGSKDVVPSAMCAYMPQRSAPEKWFYVVLPLMIWLGRARRRAQRSNRTRNA
jgi:hypothetical protein